jgi:hypothetical protein
MKLKLSVFVEIDAHVPLWFVVFALLWVLKVINDAEI